jgi:hypothetical protein
MTTTTQATALREALLAAHDHIDMDALRISHCKDAALIEAAVAVAATSAGAQPAWQASGITLSALQLREALEFAAPDFDADEDQRETEVCIAWAPENTVSDDEGGFEPAGYVIWLADYPEEGCMPLDGCNPRPLSAINATQPLPSAKRVPLTEEKIAEACGWKADMGCKPLPRELRIARAIEAAHGITESKEASHD